MEARTDPDRPMTPFLVLWCGQAVSLLGSQAVQFALIWWLTARTGSAAVLAAATMVGILPQIVLGPFIGALVDRWNRKCILFLSDLLVAVASAVLAFLFLTGSADLAPVLAALFVRALGGAFHAPAMLASTSLMVPERHLSRIQGLNQGLTGGQLIVSAPLGALLYGALPMAGVMAVDVVTAAFALAPLILTRIPQPSRTAASPEAGGSTWRDVVDGAKYLWKRDGHAALLGMAAVINLCMVPAFALLPLLVVKLGGDAMQLGGLNAAFGVGTIAGGVVLGTWGGFRKRVHTTLCALIGLGLATLALGAATSLGVALAALAGFALLVPLANGPIVALLQATVAPEYQGRVFALYGSACGMMAPWGLALAAPVAEVLGVSAWYYAGGGVCLALGIAGFLVRSLSRLEEGSGAPLAGASAGEQAREDSVAAEGA